MVNFKHKLFWHRHAAFGRPLASLFDALTALCGWEVRPAVGTRVSGWSPDVEGSNTKTYPRDIEKYDWG